MKPASFDLFQPQDWSETLNALKNYDKDAMILAGGQSLIAMMNMRIAKPKVLIDINTIKDDIDLIDHRDTIEIGPLYRQLELEIRHPLRCHQIQVTDHLFLLPRSAPLQSKCFPEYYNLLVAIKQAPLINTPHGKWVCTSKGIQYQNAVKPPCTEA